MALVGLLTFSANAARAKNGEGQNGAYRYRATIGEASPIVGGELSDPVWVSAEEIDQFIQQQTAR